MHVTRALLAVCLTAALGSITSALNSSCPLDLFHYDSIDQPGQWTGTVTLLSDEDLHGIWVRLIFDEKLTEVSVLDKFGEVVSRSDREVLVKNPKLLLKAHSPSEFKILVKYEGSKVPSLIDYRLNARSVCSDKVSQELFDGDTDNKDFLTTLLANNKHIDYQEFPGCGTTPLHESTEIKNEKASEGQWPWKASIYSKNEENEKFLCEATLITSKHVVLPAHCVSYRESDTPISVKNLIVYFVVGSAGVGVEKILLYPGYNTNSLLNDLAVVQLDKPITVDDHVRPICLGVGQKEHGILVGDAIKENIQKIQELVQTKVEIISRDECFTQQPDLKGLLTDGISCARFPEGNKVCVGNSGSGVVSLRDEGKPVWELRGVVTLGVALQNKYVCNQSSTVLFVDVAKYLKWIQAVIS